MRDIFEKVAGRLYPIINPIWKTYYPLHRNTAIHHGVEGVESDEIFADIYRNNLWNNTESRSGAGSTILQTIPIRTALPRIVRKYGIKTMLDAPCGDFNWMRHVDLGETDYIGGDVVPDLIADLQSTMAGPKRRFVLVNITRDPLPQADLWICRDVLFHLTDADCLAVLRQFAKSNIRYFLSTTYPYLPANIDLERSGGFRTINLRHAPFRLPKPIDEFNDFVAPYTPRVLGLWSREQICNVLGL